MKELSPTYKRVYDDYLFGYVFKNGWIKEQKLQMNRWSIIIYFIYEPTINHPFSSYMCIQILILLPNGFRAFSSWNYPPNGGCISKDGRKDGEGEGDDSMICFL